MKKIIIFILFALTTFSICFSYNLNGEITDNNDGSFDVTIHNEYGHQYRGEASDNADGTLDFSVRDENGETYRGTLNNNGDGTYDVEARNPDSGDLARGEVSKEFG